MNILEAMQGNDFSSELGSFGYFNKTQSSNKTIVGVA